MGEWKVQLSLRVKQQLRLDLESLAAREKRTLGNLGEVLVEWACEQLKIAGSTDQLLHKSAPIPRRPSANYHKPRTKGAS